MPDWTTDDFTPLLTRLDALSIPGVFMTARTVSSGTERRVFGFELQRGWTVIDWPEDTPLRADAEGILTHALLSLTAEQGRRVLTWQDGPRMCVRIMQPGVDTTRSQEVTHALLVLALLRAVVEHFEPRA